MTKEYQLNDIYVKLPCWNYRYAEGIKCEYLGKKIYRIGTKKKHKHCLFEAQTMRDVLPCMKNITYSIKQKHEKV